MNWMNNMPLGVATAPVVVVVVDDGRNEAVNAATEPVSQAVADALKKATEIASNVVRSLGLPPLPSPNVQVKEESNASSSNTSSSEDYSGVGYYYNDDDYDGYDEPSFDEDNDEIPEDEDTPDDTVVSSTPVRIVKTYRTDGTLEKVEEFYS